MRPAPVGVEGHLGALGRAGPCGGADLDGEGGVGLSGECAHCEVLVNLVVSSLRRTEGGIPCWPTTAEAKERRGM